MNGLDQPYLGNWRDQLRPDYAGRTRSGLYMVLFTDQHPVTGNPIWAVGYSPVSLDEAREQALSHMVEQRFGQEVVVLTGFGERR